MEIAFSVVIPCYNEERNVDILYREIRQTCDKLKRTYEIIFVDDGSSDQTFDRLKQIKLSERSEKFTFVRNRLIRFSRNYGQTPAMQAGFDHARGDVIVSLDGDLQNDPKDIPRFLDMIEEGYDVVCGWRMDRKDKTLTRIIPSKVANWLIAKITGVPIHDNGCSLKAYKSSVIKSLRIYSDMHRFIPAIATMSGARIAEIVVNHRPRKYGKTKYGLSRIWKVLFDIITIKMLIHFDDRPLFWFGMFSLLFLFLATAFGMITVHQFFIEKTSIVHLGSSFLFFSLSGFFLSMGLLGEFLIKIEPKKDDLHE